MYHQKATLRTHDLCLHLLGIFRHLHKIIGCMIPEFTRIFDIFKYWASINWPIV